MNKYSVELGINTKGYKEGVEEAKNANADFVSSVKISDTEIKKLMKEYKQAQKEATALALAFNKLSDAQKKSAEGQALARSLEEAKKQAAELYDTVADIKEEIKKAASDTFAWDAFKEGVSVGRDALSAFAALTGTEEKLGDVIKQIAQIQTAANAVISIGNALQRQSALMSGIRKVQEIALTKAIKAETSATVGATAAQRIFNTVAKANPYVLLASLAATAAVAIGGYMLATKKSAEAENEQQKELSETQKALDNINNNYLTSYASSLAKTLTTYTQLQQAYSKLTSDHQRTQWIKENESKFKELGLSIKGVKEAEDIFKNNTTDVVNAFKLRAQAAAEAARLESLYAQKIEAEENARKRAVKFEAGQKIGGSDIDRYGLQEGRDYTQNKSKIGDYTLTDEGAMKANAEATKRNIATYTGEIEQQIQSSAERLEQATTDYNNSISNLGAGGSGGNNSSNTNKQITQLQKLQAEVTKFKTQLENVDIQAPNASETIAQIQQNLKNAEKNLSNYKIAIGIEIPPSELDKMEAQLKQYQLQLRADLPQEQKDNIYQKYLELKAQIEQEQIRAHLIIDPSIEAKANVDKQKSDIMSGLTPNSSLSFDFSALSGDAAKQADETVAQLERVKSAIEQFQTMMNEAAASDYQISTAQEALEELIPVYDQLIEKANEWVEANEGAKVVAANMKKVQNTMQTIGTVGQSVSSMFTALGQATGNEGFAVAGIIAQAIAQIALGYATATSQAASMGPWAWIAFALTGLATMISMIASIKNQTAGSYAGGGIIPGSSYFGDNLTASVSSGEMILNRRQQRNLFDAIDQNKINNIGTQQSVAIESIGVRGEDIVLAVVNQGKLDHKNYLRS